MSNSIYKANFIQMSTDNVRVIDANALVAKKIEGYSAYPKEAQVVEAENAFPSTDGFSSIDISDLVTDVITSEEPVQEEEPVVTESAREILESAQAEADEIKNAAMIEAESIKENANARGYEEGYAAGIDAANRELESAQNQLMQEREQMLSEFEQMALEVEPKLVDAITRVYEKVFSKNFYNNREVVAHLIHSALMNSETENGGAILVSEDDIDMVEEARDSILARINNASEWEIKVSSKLDKGQAKIETAHGLIDCGIDTELKELSRTLHLLSYGE